MTGRARHVADDGLRAPLARQFVAERAALAVPAPRDEEQLFVFDLDTVLLTRTTRHGDPAPQHTVWRASAN